MVDNKNYSIERFDSIYVHYSFILHASDLVYRSGDVINDHKEKAKATSWVCPLLINPEVQVVISVLYNDSDDSIR